MPIYEYKCLECGRISEIFLHSLNSQNIRCPACGSYKLDKLLSASYTLKSGASMLGTTCCVAGQSVARRLLALQTTLVGGITNEIRSTSHR
jgi:putative FmdB family regulatory protein